MYLFLNRYFCEEPVLTDANTGFLRPA